MSRTLCWTVENFYYNPKPFKSTADTFAAAIEEINKADILSKTLPYDVIFNIKKHALLNVLKEYKYRLKYLCRQDWLSYEDLNFGLHILHDVADMLYYVRDVFGNRILENIESVDFVYPLDKNPTITWGIERRTVDELTMTMVLKWYLRIPDWYGRNSNFLTHFEPEYEDEGNPTISQDYVEPVYVNVRNLHNNPFGLVQPSKLKKHKKLNRQPKKLGADALRSRREKNMTHNVRNNA